MLLGLEPIIALGAEAMMLDVIFGIRAAGNIALSILAVPAGSSGNTFTSESTNQNSSPGPAEQPQNSVKMSPKTTKSASKVALFITFFSF